jgi:GxxExxY protein
MAQIPHEDITYKIIGAAMNVHNKLGPGLKEIIYHRALSVALQECGLTFQDEVPIRVAFDEHESGVLYLDHFVEGAVVVEEKSLPHLLTNEELSQVIVYLAATEAQVGLLINFGRRRLEYKRILPPKKFDEWRDRAKRYAYHDGSRYPFIRSQSVADEVPH